MKVSASEYELVDCSLLSLSRESTSDDLESDLRIESRSSAFDTASCCAAPSRATGWSANGRPAPTKVLEEEEEEEEVSWRLFGKAAIHTPWANATA